MTVTYSVSVGSADGSSVHVALGSFDASVPVGVEPSVGVGTSLDKSVEVGTSLDESVEVGTSLDESVEDVASGIGEKVPLTVALNGAAVTLKLTSSCGSPPACSIAARAVEGSVHVTRTVELEIELEVEVEVELSLDTGKARQVALPVQGVISQLPSPEQVAVLLLMHPT
jgi:hypothetical protein